MSNVTEYLIRLRDEFSAKMQSAAGVGAKGGATIAQGMAVAVAAGLKFKDQISAGWDVLNGNYEKLGTVLGALPGPLGTIGEMAGTALGKMIADTEQAAEGYRKLSAATGASVEFLSGFKEAADDVRVSGEAVDSALTKFSKGLGGIEDATEGAMAGSKGVAGTLKDIGINAYDSEGKVRPLADLLPSVADAFSKMADGPQKTAIAIQLFGKQGAELIPILNKGKEGIAEMAKAAEEAGLTMSGKTVDAVNKLKSAQDQLSDSWGALSLKIGTVAIPALTSVVDSVNYLTGASGTMAEAFSTVNLTLLQFGNAGKLTEEQFKRIKDQGANGVEVLKRFAEGGAGSNSETQRLAQELQKLYPELFKTTEETDKAAKATETLAVKQKDAATVQREYQEKLTTLTDAMSKRDKALEDIRDKEEKLVEAQKNGFITAEQLAQAQGHLRDQTEKVKAEFDGAATKIKDGATATEAMDKAAAGAAQRERDYQKATEDAAKAAEDLKTKTDNLTEGFGKLPEKMDAAAKAAMAWKLATGQMTTADAEQTLVAQGLTQAYTKHKITLKEMVQLGQQYRSGEITGEQALQQAGAWKDPAFINQAKNYREVEKAAGKAGASELEHADYIKITTRILSQKRATVDDLAYAQNYLNKANEADSKLLAQAKQDMEAKKISEIDYQKVIINTGIEHDKLAAATSKLESAVKSGTVTTTGSTIVTDNWNKHLAELGLTVDKTGKIIEALPAQKEFKVHGDATEVDDTHRKVTDLKTDADKGATVTVSGDTKGLTEPVAQAKADAEKPVTVPVTFQNLTAPSFGAGASAPSMTLPVSFDASSVQVALDKLPKTKGVSLALDTISFDQSLLRASAALAKLPDESVTVSIDVPSSVNLPDLSKLTGKTVDIKADASTVASAIDEAQKKIDALTGKTVSVAITSSGSLSLPTASSITVRVTGDTADAATKIKGVIDTIIPEKTAYVSGDDTGATASIKAINDKVVEAKTLTIAGVNASGAGASAGIAAPGSKPFALDAIDAVNAAEIPLKTAVIAADNTHAMSAITNTKAALESIKDKTVFVNVVRNDITSDGSGNSGSGGNNNDGGGGFGHQSVRDRDAGRGTGRGIVVYQTFQVGSDLDLALVQREIKRTFAELINR